MDRFKAGDRVFYTDVMKYPPFPSGIYTIIEAVEYPSLYHSDPGPWYIVRLPNQQTISVHQKFLRTLSATEKVLF